MMNKRERVEFLHGLTLQAKTDITARGQLYTEVENLIYKECYKYTNIDLFENLVSVANMSFCKAVNQYKSEFSYTGFIPFLQKIIYYDILYYARKMRNDKYNEVIHYDDDFKLPDGSVVNFLEVLKSEVNLEEEVAYKYDLKFICEAIDKLKPKEKAILDLYYFKSYKQCKVAEMVGTSQAEVSRSKIRALKKLKKILITEYGWED